MASLGVSTLYVKTFIYWNASNITKSGHEPTNPVKPQVVFFHTRQGRYSCLGLWWHNNSFEHRKIIYPTVRSIGILVTPHSRSVRDALMRVPISSRSSAREMSPSLQQNMLEACTSRSIYPACCRSSWRLLSFPFGVSKPFTTTSWRSAVVVRADMPVMAMLHIEKERHTLAVHGEASETQIVSQLSSARWMDTVPGQPLRPAQLRNLSLHNWSYLV
jgi:hypothetical protein